MHYISETLYWISTGLMVPVVLLLIMLFVRALWLIIGFFGQYVQVKREEAILREQFKQVDATSLDKVTEALAKAAHLLVTPYLTEMIQHTAQAHHLNLQAAEFELAADKELSTCKTLTKLGPMLGLMGTLIPMGPALVGLAQGDISSMAYNMQVAFATTVVGLFCSATGYLIGQIKERWFFHQQAYLQCLLDLFTNPKENSHA